MLPSVILWKSLRLEVSKRKNSHGVLIFNSGWQWFQFDFSKFKYIRIKAAQYFWNTHNLNLTVFFLPCQKSLKTFSIHKPIFVSNRCDTPNKWEWHEASAVALNSICDAPWTRWQCSLFCCLSLFITPSSLDNIQKLIPLGNLCASLPRVFSRAELSLQHQAKALPGNEQHPAGSCIKVIHYTEEADFKILENVTLWKRKNKNQFPIFS